MVIVIMMLVIVVLVFSMLVLLVCCYYRLKFIRMRLFRVRVMVLGLVCWVSIYSS